MSVPIALVVTQWVILLALGTLVLVMYRQLAHLLEIADSAHDAGGLAIGEHAASFEYRPRGGPDVRRFGPEYQPTLLLFSDPRCGACDKVVEMVDRIAGDGHVRGLQVLVLTDADEIAVAANDALSRTTLEVGMVERHVVNRDFKVTGTPLLVGIDAAGVVRAKVAGADEGAVRRFVTEFRESLDHGRRGDRRTPEAVIPEEEVRTR